MFVLPQKIHSGLCIRETLGTAHANLDIILASTVRYASFAITYYPNTETDLLHHEGHERPDSDYESVLDSIGRGQDAFINDIANESYTEMLNGTPGSLAAKRRIMKAPEKQLETLMDLSKNVIF